MRLAELIDNLDVTVRNGAGQPDPEITSITEDSRTIAPGALFIARRGAASDGNQYVPQAIASGAAAILTDHPNAHSGITTSGVAILTSPDLARATAFLAERFHGSSTRALDLIGITGTNGKTTVAFLIRQLLNDAELRCGLLGTVEIDDGAQRVAADLTTPPALLISGTMARMVRNGCTACAMEVSSHALAQQRVAALDFNVGIFTNLTGDHLDYHGTLDDYAAAKAQFFAMLPRDGVAIVNGDDPQAERMVRGCAAPVVRCSVHSENARAAPQAAEGEEAAVAIIHEQIMHGMRLTLRGGFGEIETHLRLLGRHNAMNALQATVAAHHVMTRAKFTAETQRMQREEKRRFGSRSAADEAPCPSLHSSPSASSAPLRLNPLSVLSQALADATAPPGRFELVTQPGHPFAVLVDYAHTDDALRNALSALRPIVPAQGRLRVVFGCGGDRDRTKRPRMAAVACALADDVIITSDNPRTEDPLQIVNDVERGVPAAMRDSVTSIVDRAAAIAEAVRRAEAGDIICIAGKGHETYQIVGKMKRDFDDRVEARRALAARFDDAAAVEVVARGRATPQAAEAQL